MTMDTVEVPKNFWEGILSRFGSQEPTPAEEPEPVTITETEEFKAVVKERDEYAAKIQKQEADAKKAELHASIISDLQNQELYGMNYIELSGAQEAAEQLATMTDTQREWVTRNFRAFIAQIDESNLTGEKGSSAEADENPAAAFNAAIKAIQDEQKVEYVQAVQIATDTKPELFAAYKKAQKGER